MPAAKAAPLMSGAFSDLKAAAPSKNAVLGARCSAERDDIAQTIL